MTEDNLDIPDEFKNRFRKHLLEQLKHDDGWGIFELSLFEWYARESEKLISEMLAAEHAVIQEQLDSGLDDINDSGIVAVEYYTKRARYSHVIYLTSLMETYLTKACDKLTTAVGEQNIVFGLYEVAGDKWTKRRKFLERYGRFEIPENLWSPVSILTCLRNNLVHDNGDTGALGNEEKKRCREIPGVRLDGLEVEIEYQYIELALSSLRELTEFVKHQIDRIIDRAMRPQSLVGKST